MHEHYHTKRQLQQSCCHCNTWMIRNVEVNEPLSSSRRCSLFSLSSKQLVCAVAVASVTVLLGNEMSSSFTGNESASPATAMMLRVPHSQWRQCSVKSVSVSDPAALPLSSSPSSLPAVHSSYCVAILPSLCVSPPIRHNAHPLLGGCQKQVHRLRP